MTAATGSTRRQFAGSSPRLNHGAPGKRGQRPQGSIRALGDEASRHLHNQLPGPYARLSESSQDETIKLRRPLCVARWRMESLRPWANQKWLRARRLQALRPMQPETSIQAGLMPSACRTMCRNAEKQRISYRLREAHADPQEACSSG